MKYENRAHRQLGYRVRNASTQNPRESTAAMGGNRDQVRAFSPRVIGDRVSNLFADYHVDGGGNSLQPDLTSPAGEISLRTGDSLLPPGKLLAPGLVMSILRWCQHVEECDLGLFQLRQSNRALEDLLSE